MTVASPMRWDLVVAILPLAIASPCFITALFSSRLFPTHVRFVDPDDELAEVAPLQHADEGLRRLLQAVDEVLAIPDVAVSDAGADFSQERGKVLGGKVVVDEA